MTTNHLQKLDPALVRPGRCDVHIKLDYASPNQMRKMFTHFYSHGIQQLGGAKQDSHAEGDAEAVDRVSGKPSASSNPSAGQADLTGRPSPSTSSVAVAYTTEELETMAQTFAQRCSRKQLAPAALQGHLLKHRDDPGAASSQAAVDSLLQAQGKISTVGNLMSIHEWLFRAGMEQYLPGFESEGVITVDDIDVDDPGSFSKYGVTIRGHQRQLAALRAGDEDAMKEFAWCSPTQVERRIMECFSQEESIEEARDIPGADALGLESRTGAAAKRGYDQKDTKAGLQQPIVLRRSSSASTDVVVAADVKSAAEQAARIVSPNSLSLAQVSKVCSAALGAGGGACTTGDLVEPEVLESLQDRIAACVRTGRNLMRGKQGAVLDLLAVGEDPLAAAGIEG